MIEDNNRQSFESKFTHYYGDIVRKHLFFAGFVLLLAALLDSELRSFYLFIGVFGALVFTVLAGLTSPLKRGVMVTNVVVAGTMFVIFEYAAIAVFGQYQDFSNTVFLLRQFLAIIFLITLYFSTKSIREMQK